MKRITFLFIACGIISGMASAQEEVVAGWTFPGDDLFADTGLAINLTKEIATAGGTSSIEIKNGYSSKAAQASGWNEGAGQKAWVVSLNTMGYGNLTLSSRQQSGGNDPGPKYFKLQVSTDSGTNWSDLDGGDVNVENDWETSFVDELPLPESCQNLETLLIRWMMASDEASGDGGDVLEDGKSKIDEIFVRGEQINAVPERPLQGFTILPGMHAGSQRIVAREEMKVITVNSLSGRVLVRNVVNSDVTEIELDRQPPQFVILTILFQEGTMSSGKFFIK